LCSNSAPEAQSLALIVTRFLHVLPMKILTWALISGCLLGMRMNNVMLMRYQLRAEQEHV
jgi:hypothetical protein